VTNPADPSQTSSDPSPVNALADGFWESILALSPTTATVYGDERYDDRLPDPGPEGRAEARSLAEETRARADAMPTDGLTVEERITLDMVKVVCDLTLRQDDERIDRIKVVDQLEGPQQVLPVITQFQAADTPERLERFLARLAAYPAFMAANTELLHEGLTSEMTASRVTTERTIAQLERMLAIPPEESVIVQTARVASDADRERVLEAVREYVYPGDAAFLEGLRGEYLHASREEPGLWSAPNGDELYRTQILAWTTLEIDPRDLHRIGLDELEAIERERGKIASAAGFDDPRTYRAHLAKDPANIPHTREDLLARAREDIERAMAIAPRYFGRVPRSTCSVKAVEEFKEADAPFAYYFPPTVDGSRPGVYYVNTYDLPSRTFTKLATTTYHEAVPGHHFQIGLEMEHPDLPAFRRLGSRLVGGAYVEGWGLYAEHLADEMGLFRNDGERFGMLDAMAWRAARLVVDTGIHALEWTREQGVAQMLAAGLSDTDANIETNRYITWPGQALTYKVGQREIERLRAEIARRDGSRFDLKAFHDQVLGHGALPLATLARELPTWVATPA
jgi:uncharacterized protein (DUF885 family)